MLDSQEIFIILILLLFSANQNAESETGDGFSNINEIVLLLLLFFVLCDDNSGLSPSNVAGANLSDVNFRCARRRMNCRNDPVLR